MSSIVQNIRYALRTLVKSPGYTAVVIATLALGIGGTTAMFTLVDGVLLKPLPYPEPDRLALLFESLPMFRERYPFVPVNAYHFQQWSEKSESFYSMSLFDWDEETLTELGEPRRVGVIRIDAEFFPTLGVNPRLGRNITREETDPGNGTVVLVTDRFWRRELEGDPNALGRELTLNGRAYAVIGVLSSNFRFLELNRIGPFGADLGDIDLFRPIQIAPEKLAAAGEHNYAALGRLRSGVRPEQAQAELDVLQATIAEEVGGKFELEAIVKPLGRTIIGDSGDALWLGFGAVGMVLLIGCVNVANLTIGRSVRREAEYATRAALGAGRSALVRQAMAESLCLSTAGGIFGAWFAWLAIGWFGVHAPVDLPRLSELAIDSRVLAFAFVATVVSAILFGLLPALRFSGVRPSIVLSGTTRGSVGSHGARRLGDWLVAGEIALSTALLVVAGLLAHSLFAVLDQQRGFETENVATTRISLPPAKYRDRETRAKALRAILGRIEATPGVESAGVVTLLPLTQEDNVNPILPAEAVPVPPIERPMANFRWASPGYFDAMGIRVLDGRGLREEETIERPVAISVATAERLWPGESAVGREIRPGDDKPPYYQVVGVVADTPVASLERGSAMVVYRSYEDRPRNSMALVVRSTLDHAVLTPAVRGAIWELEPEAPAVEMEPAADLVAASTSERGFQAMLLLVFAGVALALACLGVYGVLTQTVSRRTNEIGLRMALGAEAGQVRGLVLHQGLMPVAWGLAAGCVGAAISARLLRTMLFGVSPLDPLTFVAVPVVLLTAALIACLIPARRAARIDPITALRHE